MLSFHPLPQPTSCASTTFSWSYNGPNDPLLLQVTNVGVTQDAPPSTTTSSSTNSSIATARYFERSAPTIPISPMNLTVTLVTNYNPSALSYDWNTVNVSQGWYILLAIIRTNPISQTPSLPFFVRTGSNISCLDVTGKTPTPTNTPSASSSLSLNTSTPVSGTSTSKVPTIVGVSVGMAVLVIGVLIVLWFILTRKRKSNRTSDGYNKYSFHRWKGLSDSRGGFDANAPKYRSSRSHLVSQPASFVTTLGPEFEVGIIGLEKSTDEHGVALSTLPVLQHQSSRSRPDHTYSASSSSSNVNEFGGKSSTRYSTQHSIESSAVYPPSTRESGQYIVAPDVVRSHSLSTTGTRNSFSNSIDPPISPSFPLPPSITSREAKQMHRQSIGKKRKPAPVYQPSADEHISSTSATFAPPHSTNTELSFPELSHKGSFGPGGIEGKPLHYLIPDMPLSHTS